MDSDSAKKKDPKNSSGMLYLCATPIGNLKDITERVKETLGSVDIIAAEDTRNSIRLLNHFGIKTPMTSYHEHNKYEKADTLIAQMMDGKDVALITDAGTPAISDPGEVLVRRCHEEGITVTSLPGACACITALTLSGLNTRRFVFEGFLPYDKKERQSVLESLKDEHRTVIMYEAPHHLKKTLADLLDTIGDRRLTICRELTKKFESVTPTTLSEAVAYHEDNEPRGEYVLVIEGRDPEEIERDRQKLWEDMSIEDHMALYLDAGMDRKEAMKKVASDRGVSKREIYEKYSKKTS
ncbi:MAG: 16S rRNA (cytidine(1402)-2'-O)-methyltransferase [Lachnospiraceae bacterium]|nr:16S rRNA (cytidine(1402)-2'-O)-methyltransferase [Lachnospiraceae bacterium]